MFSCLNSETGCPLVGKVYTESYDKSFLGKIAFFGRNQSKNMFVTGHARSHVNGKYAFFMWK
jgi:hypothetical protein